ncbi:hypothetical protein E2C01_034321 [Portunus trituberculatus]|uniref:Uncharacterized protein n=1 Tax=Portunus trituberculatus TaxID=210409 RepID=A0A5B7F594_PORTR|nr:hypothetical protein [Portunus trituberculatus]
MFLGVDDETEASGGMSPCRLKRENAWCGVLPGVFTLGLGSRGSAKAEKDRGKDEGKKEGRKGKREEFVESDGEVSIP